MESKLKEKGLTLYQDNGDEDNDEKGNHLNETFCPQLILS